MSPTEFNYIRRMIQQAMHLAEDCSTAVLTINPTPEQTVALAKPIANLGRSVEVLSDSVSCVMQMHSSMLEGQEAKDLDSACGEGRR